MGFVAKLQAKFQNLRNEVEDTWFFQLKVPKCILIENWRLAVLLRLLQGITIIGFLGIVYNEGSLNYVNQNPVVSANFSIDDGAPSVRNRSLTEANSTLCDPDFMGNLFYQRQEQNHWHKMQPQGCVAPLSGEWWERGENTIYIPTYVAESVSEQTSGFHECVALQKSCTGEYQKFSLAIAKAQTGNDICRCDTQTEFFTRGVGGLTLEIDAQYSVPFLQGNGVHRGSTRNRENLHVMLIEPSMISRKDFISNKMGKVATEKSVLEQLAKGVSDGIDDKRSDQNVAGDLGSQTKSVAQDASLVQVSADALSDDSQPLEHVSHQRMIRKESTIPASTLSPTSEWSSSAWRDHSRYASGKASKDHDESLLSEPGVAEAETGEPNASQDDDDDDNASAGNRTSYENITKQIKPPETEVHTHHTSGRKVIKNLTEHRSSGGLVFHNNERIVMSLEDWIKHALLLKGSDKIIEPLRFGQYGEQQVVLDTGSFLDLPNFAVAANSSTNGTNETFIPPFRMTGIELHIYVDVLNYHAWKKRSDMEKAVNTGKGIVSNEEENQHTGDFVQLSVEAVPGWHGHPRTYPLHPRDPVTGVSKVVTRQSNGIVIRIIAGGRFSTFSYAAFISFVTSLVVSFQIPELLVGGIALYLMSSTSNFYYYIANERSRIKRSLVGCIARKLGWWYLFNLEVSAEHKLEAQEEAQDEEHEAGYVHAPLRTPKVTAKCVVDDINEALGRTYSSDLTDTFSRLVLKEMRREGMGKLQSDDNIDKTTQMSAHYLAGSAIADEKVRVKEFEEIYSERPWTLFEQVFLPDAEKNMEDDTALTAATASVSSQAAQESDKTVCPAKQARSRKSMVSRELVMRIDSVRKARGRRSSQ